MHSCGLEDTADKPLVVVIPTAGRAKLLSRTLDSLAKVRKPSCYVETIVVENGPQGDAEEITSVHRDSLNSRYLHVSERGKSNALNEAFKQLDDECLAYLTDDDVRFSPNVLDAFVDAAKDKGLGWFFGGTADVDYETLPPEWLVQYLPADAREFTERDFANGSRYMVFLGYNWAAYAGDIRRAGGFDSRFGPGGSSGAIGQESEMQQRLLQHSIKPCFVPDSTVWHYVPIDHSSKEWFVYRHYRYGILDAMHSGLPKNRLGLPWWHTRKFGKSAIAYLKSCFDRDEERRFLAKRDLYFRWGQLTGAWRATKEAKPSGEEASKV